MTAELAPEGALVSPARRHHWMNEGSTLCYDATARRSKSPEAEFCGACFLLMSTLNLVTRLPWEDGSCRPVQEKPSEALARLRGTPWQHHWDLRYLRNTDEQWWFNNLPRPHRVESVE